MQAYASIHRKQICREITHTHTHKELKMKLQLKNTVDSHRNCWHISNRHFQHVSCHITLVCPSSFRFFNCEWQYQFFTFDLNIFFLFAIELLWYLKKSVLHESWIAAKLKMTCIFNNFNAFYKLEFKYSKEFIFKKKAFSLCFNSEIADSSFGLYVFQHQLFHLYTALHE